MKNIIINADDFGISQEVNEAIEYCFIKGLINQTTLMVNMPYTENAVELAKRSGFDKLLGLHLNLVEGTPLTDNIKNTSLCEEGEFNGAIMKNRKYRFFLDTHTCKCVEEELEAQIKRYLSFNVGKKHIDSHQHFHTNPSVIRILLPLVKKYEFESVRLTRNIPREEIRGLKGIYKRMFNKTIVASCKNTGDTDIVANFGSIIDVSKSKNLDGLTEMMVHPIINRGKLEDAFCDICLENWWIENKEKFIFLD